MFARATSAKAPRGFAAPLKNTRPGWLAAALLAAGLAGCGTPANETIESAPRTTAVTPPPMPVVAVSPTASATPTAPAIETKAPPATASNTRAQPERPAAPEPLEAAPTPEAAAPVPEAVEAPAAPAPPATRTQAGRVLDEDGRPLVGATILLKGSSKGTSTDATGSYSLEVPNGENTLLIGYGGYQDETAVSRDAQPLNVTLLPTPGKGKQRRK